MNQINYLIAFLANLAMIVIGGILICLGVIQVLGTIGFMAILEQDFMDGQTVGEAMGNGQGALDPMSAPSLWLFMVGKIVLGGPLIYFGVRGLMRRVHAGVPDETEELPEPGEINLKNVLIYGAGALVGFLLLISRLMPFADEMILTVAGETVTGVVDREWQSDGSDGEQRGKLYVTYVFDTRTGELVTDKTGVRTTDRGFIVENGRLNVTYLPSNPAFNMPTHRLAPEDYLFKILLLSGVFFVGVWGVMRNLGMIGRPQGAG